MKVLFVGKKNDLNTEQAANYCKQIFESVEVVLGDWGDKKPEQFNTWSGDYIFSYLSPWIIPDYLLTKANKGGVNWHPGPPEYPGIGCTNFAIYNDEKVFGITCHYMLPKVDTGKVIEVKRFKVLENDSVLSITKKCYAQILCSFYGIIEIIASGISLPKSNEDWTRIPYTRKELDALSEISLDMSEEEINKRIRATTYDRPWAFINVNGKKFHLK